MLASDLLRAGLVASFVLVATLERLPLLVVLASLQATVGVFFGPARGALVARAVPREGLLAANSLSQISRIAFGLIGTGVTGVVAASPAWSGRCSSSTRRRSLRRSPRLGPRPVDHEADRRRTRGRDRHLRLAA